MRGDYVFDAGDFTGAEFEDADAAAPQSEVQTFASRTRTAELLNNALNYLSEAHLGSDLYGVLRGAIGMTREEIKAAGFYNIPDAD